ncbi:MAG: FAD-dependent oxidoreductase [Ruthenibacterium sp.]
MITVSQIRLPLCADSDEAVRRALRLLHASREDVSTADIAKISVDARRGAPELVYSVAVALKDKGAEQAYAGCAPCVTVAQPPVFVMPRGSATLSHPPVICGLGPAGLFCALALARAGYRPVVLERGPDMQQRRQAVREFYAGGALRENANIQFGEGGAGTFSDGKLTTRITSPLCAFVTQTLLQYGAPREIAFLQKPHIGTDALCSVITAIREEIIALGGTVHFHTPLTGMRAQGGRITAVRTPQGEIPCEVLVLAVGHSARDTFAMLQNMGLTLLAKPFSVGFRAEHLQSRIEQSLYHAAAGHPALPRGEYQLSHHVGGRCVYTFCMCPGGSVVAAASEAGGVLTNGMSQHARDGKNANAAVVVSVGENDFGGDALRAIAFQRDLEQKAFAAGGGDYTAPAENAQSFLHGQGKLHIAALEPTYPRGVRAYDLGSLLPAELTGALRTGLAAFEHRLHGYTAPEVILTGLETRTSSPVRLPRAENGESIDIAGMYPCGEGAGYAGGIMSAAADGLKTAQCLAARYAPFGV